MVSLPESEYIELFNRTDLPLKLKGWKLLVNGKTLILDSCTIESGGYMLLVPASKGEEWQYVKNKLLLSPWQALTNSECTFVLISDNGNVIDVLQYSLKKWGDGSFKDDGGWSIERVDMDNMSGSSENWLYSADISGGTPGNENSVHAVNPDDQHPEVTKITYNDTSSITVYFSEPVDILPGDIKNLFEIKNNTITVADVEPDTVFLDNCSLVFDTDMKTNMVHEFSKIKVSDLAGNDLRMNANRFLGQPDTVSTYGHDIVLNEILFNPRQGGSDFVELFNLSSKIFNLSQLYFADTDDEDNITKLYALSDDNVLVFPGEYHVFTVSPENIIDEYSCPVPEWMHVMQTMPSMPDDSGTVTLCTRTGETLDRLRYSSLMHFPLLNDKEGVSLERVSPGAATDDPANWKSASADCGYATPTGKNSQFREISNSAGTGFFLEKELFTPDGDGYDDFLVINYSFDEPETVATVRIYNAKGIQVKTIANNRLLGTSGFLTWDGTNRNGFLVKPGIYIILAETYDLSGFKTKQKLTCVAGTRSTP
jgi:hypothetical protein